MHNVIKNPVTPNNFILNTPHSYPPLGGSMVAHSQSRSRSKTVIPCSLPRPHFFSQLVSNEEFVANLKQRKNKEQRTNIERWISG